MMEGSPIGHYRVLRKLGEGGMGIVFEAVHAAIGRHVAIKILHPEYARNAEFARRFINEARVVNRVDHPGLIQISDYGQLADGTAYIVMEYVKGQTLRDRLESAGGRFSVADTVSLSLHVADSLAAAHAEGIVHRDLKPDNVIVTRSNRRGEGERTKLLDFGIAKLLEDNRDHIKTKTHAVMGTPAYMAPEQCRGAGGVDHKADVYSLGIMMYLMSAGCLPFVAEGFGEVLGKHMYEEPPPLAPLVPAAPETLVRLIHRMMSKDKNQRPGMVQVVAELSAIEQELAGEAHLAEQAATRIVHVSALADVSVAKSTRSEYVSTLGWYNGQARAASRQRTMAFLGASLGLLFVFGMGGRSFFYGQPATPSNKVAVSAKDRVVMPKAAASTPVQQREPVVTDVVVPPSLHPVVAQLPAPEKPNEPVPDTTSTVVPQSPTPRSKPAKTDRPPMVPTEGENLVMQGRAKLAAKEFDGAAALFALAVGLEPRNADAVGGLGQVSFAQGDYESAARYLAAAIKLEPRRSTSYQELLGQVLYQSGHLQEAAETLRKLLVQDPSSQLARQILDRIEKVLRHQAVATKRAAAS